MNAHITRAVGYVRVSTEEQAREGISIEAQEERIKSLATAKGWSLGNIIRDAGYSGKNLNRPGAKALLDICRNAEADVVVVLKVDRLTRKQRDLWYFLEEVFEANRVGFVSVTEAFDTTTASGKAFLGMIGTFAQLERDLVSERTREALGHKRRKGEWVGRVPLGFKINEVGRLDEDPTVFRLIDRAKRLRREGASFRDISRSLGIPKTTAYRVVNADPRKLKYAYINSLRDVAVP